MQPDELDQKIIDTLREGYKPNSVIARELGVVEGTVRARLKRLQDSGVLTIKALIDPEVLQDKQLAMIAVNVKESRLLSEKAAELSELDEVISASIVSGQYDILVEVLVDSNSGLVNFLTECLPKVEGIQTTESFVTLRSYKKYV